MLMRLVRFLIVCLGVLGGERFVTAQSADSAAAAPQLVFAFELRAQVGAPTEIGG